MGGIVSGFFGSSTPSQPNLQVWQPQYQGAADTQAYNSISGINSNNPYQQLQPVYSGVLQSQLNNPYAAGAQTAANSSGQQLGQLGQTSTANANAIAPAAMSLLPYVGQVENTAMDPQSALYNRTLQQLQDQSGVANAKAGLSNSPYGAAASNSAQSNFNIDWQNNALARQAQGISSAATGIGAAAGGATQAANLANSGAAATLGSGAVPLTAYNNNLNNTQSALNNYSSGQVAGNQNTQTAVADLMSYLGLGATQSNQQASNNQTAYQDQLSASNTANQGLASIANSLFGGLTSGLTSGLNSATGSNFLSSLGATAANPSSDAEWAAFLAAA